MENSPQNSPDAPSTENPVPLTQPQPIQQPAPGEMSSTESVFHKINRVTALILVFCAILFAIVSILAIWQVFGDDTDEIVWRSLSSLATIAFASLVINVASKLIEVKTT